MTEYLIDEIANSNDVNTSRDCSFYNIHLKNPMFQVMFALYIGAVHKFSFSFVFSTDLHALPGGSL